MESRGQLPRKAWRALHATEVSSYLRVRIDEWLKTGLNQDGSESPRSKNLFATEQGRWAVMNYLEKHPPNVMLHADSPGLTVIFGRVRWEQSPQNEFFLTRAKEADRLFTAVMVGDWKESLCKCRYSRCGRYFMLPKPRRLYKHGTFCCREHQRLTSATTSTKDRRSRAVRDLIDLAAERLVKWQACGKDTKWHVRGPDWQDDTSLKNHLAAALSAVLARNPNLHANRQEVKVNWVTRHRAEIEQKRVTLTSKPGGSPAFSPSS